MRTAIAAILAASALAACTHYHTTEYRTRPGTNTVVVPQAPPPTVVQEHAPDMVLPKDSGPDTESVTVAPDSTVTVNRPPSNR